MTIAMFVPRAVAPFARRGSLVALAALAVSSASGQVTFFPGVNSVGFSSGAAPGATMYMTPLPNGMGFDGQAGTYTGADWKTADTDGTGLTFTSIGFGSGFIPQGSQYLLDWTFGLNFTGGQVEYTLVSTVLARAPDNSIFQTVARMPFSGVSTPAVNGFNVSSTFSPSFLYDANVTNWNLFLEVFWTGQSPTDTISIVIPPTAAIRFVVPTPGSAALLTLGAGLLTARRRR
jgi:hypothetical protein